MPILALDVGEVYLGMAISDPSETIALPLPTLKRTSLPRDLEEIVRLIEERRVEKVVVGLPLSLKGGKTEQTKKVEEFAQALKEKISIPLLFLDERFTTTIALKTLRMGKRKPSREKGLADRVAAIIILQNFLDGKMKERDS